MTAWVKTIWYRLTTQRVDRLNTLDMLGDLDKLELLIELEDHFHIKFTDGEARDLITLGQAYDNIVKKLSGRLDEKVIWDDLSSISRSYTVSKYPFDRKTTFFAQYAQERDRFDP